MRYWIKDEDKTPQRFPLKSLLKQVIYKLGASTYQIWVLRAEGYGVKICEWNTLLDEQDRILVSYDLLEELSLGTEEWFYNLDVEVITDDVTIRLGLHDSAALYIEAPINFLEPILKCFSNVQQKEEK